MNSIRFVLSGLALVGMLFGCDQLGIQTPSAREAEGQAVGGACRQAGRALEDCYTLNPQVSRAAIFAGWKEMDQYMRENDLREIAPVLPPPQLEAKKKKKKTEAKPEGEGEVKPSSENSLHQDSKVAAGHSSPAASATASAGAGENRPALRPASGRGAQVMM